MEKVREIIKGVIRKLIQRLKQDVQGKTNPEIRELGKKHFLMSVEELQNKGFTCKIDEPDYACSFMFFWAYDPKTEKLFWIRVKEKRHPKTKKVYYVYKITPDDKLNWFLSKEEIEKLKEGIKNSDSKEVVFYVKKYVNTRKEGGARF